MRVNEAEKLLIYEADFDLREIERLIKANDLRGLEILSVLSDENYGDLSFLGEALFLKSLRIVSRFPYDTKFIARLKNLERLILNIRGLRDFDFLQGLTLKSLSLSMSGSDAKLAVPDSVSRLYLEDISSSSLHFLQASSELRHLEIKASKLRTLDGLENFVGLETLKLAGISSVKSIGPNLPPHLRSIRVNSLHSLAKIEIPDGNSQINLEVINCRKLME